MEDVFKSINKITRTKEHTKAYIQPIFNSVSQVATESINEVSHGKYSSQGLLVKCIIVLILAPVIILILASHTIPIALSSTGITEGHSTVIARTT